MRKKPPTVFEEHVYKLVRQIPKGQVTTYQKVAEQLSPSRNLGRAVGNALKKNPILLRKFLVIGLSAVTIFWEAMREAKLPQSSKKNVAF